MKPLVDPSSVERVLLYMAVAGPLAGFVLGTVLSVHARRAASRIIAGVLIGALGSVVYAMWRLYGVITDALGLDTVLNLALQIVMFAFLGALLGAVIYKLKPPSLRQGDTDT